MMWPQSHVLGGCEGKCSKGGVWEKTCMREVGEKGVCDSV